MFSNPRLISVRRSPRVLEVKTTPRQIAYRSHMPLERSSLSQSAASPRPAAFGGRRTRNGGR